MVLAFFLAGPALRSLLWARRCSHSVQMQWSLRFQSPVPAQWYLRPCLRQVLIKMLHGQYLTHPGPDWWQCRMEMMLFIGT
jgi:hypothetical protein